jgi:hypothetical protein
MKIQFSQDLKKKKKKHPVLYWHYSTHMNNKRPVPFSLAMSFPSLLTKPSVVSLEPLPPHIHARREKRGGRGEMRGRA